MLNTEATVNMARPTLESGGAPIEGRGITKQFPGKGRMFTQTLQNKVLDGGETKKFEEHAATSLPPGTYVAIATLHSSNYPVQERVAFELR